MNVLRHWLDIGVDGFRVDAIRRLFKHKLFSDNPPNLNMVVKGKRNSDAYDKQFHINDMHQPEVHEVLREFRRLLDSYEHKRKDKPLAMVAEVFGDPKDTITYFGDVEQKSPEFHLVFNFTMMHLPWSSKHFQNAYEEFEFKVPPNCFGALVFGSHDENRLVSRYGVAGSRVAALMLLTLKGAPYIYYGDEIGMVDGDIPVDKIQDPWAIRTGVSALSRDPGRTPMQWSPEVSTSAGFSSKEGVVPWLPTHKDASLINVETQNKDSNSLLNFYKQVIRYRKSSKTLTFGKYQPLNSVKENQVPDDVYAFVREHKGKRCVVALNFSTIKKTISLSSKEYSKEGTIIISTNSSNTAQSLSFFSKIELGPNEGLLIEEK